MHNTQIHHLITSKQIIQHLKLPFAFAYAIVFLFDDIMWSDFFQRCSDQNTPHWFCLSMSPIRKGTEENTSNQYARRQEVDKPLSVPFSPSYSSELGGGYEFWFQMLHAPRALSTKYFHNLPPGPTSLHFHFFRSNLSCNESVRISGRESF